MYHILKLRSIVVLVGRVYKGFGSADVGMEQLARVVGTRYEVCALLVEG
jgi:hypothetical protein